MCAKTVKGFFLHDDPRSPPTEAVRHPFILERDLDAARSLLDLVLSIVDLIDGTSFSKKWIN